MLDSKILLFNSWTFDGKNISIIHCIKIIYNIIKNSKLLFQFYFLVSLHFVKMILKYFNLYIISLYFSQLILDKNPFSLLLLTTLSCFYIYFMIEYTLVRFSAFISLKTEEYIYTKIFTILDEIPINIVTRLSIEKISYLPENICKSILYCLTVIYPLSFLIFEIIVIIIFMLYIQYHEGILLLLLSICFYIFITYYNFISVSSINSNMKTLLDISTDESIEILRHLEYYKMSNNSILDEKKYIFRYLSKAMILNNVLLIRSLFFTCIKYLMIAFTYFFLFLIILKDIHITNYQLRISSIYILISFFHMVYYPIDVMVNKLNDLYTFYCFEDLCLLKDILKLSKRSYIKKSSDVYINKIEFHNVYFSYSQFDHYIPSKKDVLHNINFTLKKGEKLGIIGPTNSGKTTISKLLLGLLFTDNGLIKFNDVSIKNLDIHKLQKRILFVPKEPRFIELTLLYNLNLDNPRKHILNNLITKNITIENQSLVFDNMISPSKNKILFDRHKFDQLLSLIQNNDVIIFDDPSAVFDIYTEIELLELLKNECNEKIVIILAHRLTVAYICDKLLTLDINGCQDEFGSHEELINNKSNYYHLWIKCQKLLCIERNESMNFESKQTYNTE